MMWFVKENNIHVIPTYSISILATFYSISILTSFYFIDPRVCYNFYFYLLKNDPPTLAFSILLNLLL